MNAATFDLAALIASEPDIPDTLWTMRGTKGEGFWIILIGPERTPFLVVAPDEATLLSAWSRSRCPMNLTVRSEERTEETIRSKIQRTEPELMSKKTGKFCVGVLLVDADRNVVARRYYR